MGIEIHHFGVFGGGEINSFVGKANHYGTHVVPNKKCCALQENVVSKQFTLMTRKQLINMLLTTKC